MFPDYHRFISDRVETMKTIDERHRGAFARLTHRLCNEKSMFCWRQSVNYTKSLHSDTLHDPIFLGAVVS